MRPVRGRAGDVLELDDVDAGSDGMRGQLAAMCRARWDSASELEQAFLVFYPEAITMARRMVLSAGR